MKLTPQELEDVEKLAYAYNSRTEIAIILQKDVAQFILECNMNGSDIFYRFQAGRLKRNTEYNLRVMKLTDQLSSPAMAIEQKIKERTEMNDLKNM